ncbi:MAG TPA: zf-HC2 domain-containing protein, partial [Anaerolineae bacterium]|nr:zf-HC2 domain-containing protein [Anaerolineae bacterium]
MNLRDCRSIQTIVPDWVAGRLPDAMTSGLRRHLDRCPDCRVVVAEWRRVAAALEAARPTLAPPPPAIALAKVDRFRHTQPAGPVAPRPVAPRPVARWVMAMGLLLLAGIAVWRLRPGDAPDKASRSNAGQDSDPRLSAVIGRSSDSADPAALPPA